MKKRKNNKTFNIIVILVILMILGTIITNLLKPKAKYYYHGLPVEYIKEEPIYNTSTKERAIGASDYVFVGKVNKILRVEHEKKLENKQYIYTPKTIYSVSVLKNIKGKLTLDKDIEITVFGGLHRNETKFILYNKINLLKDNEYYIFLPYLTADNKPMLLNFPYQIISLGKEYDKEIKNDLVELYQKAFKNEIVPDEGTYIVPKAKYYSIYDQKNYSKP